MLPRAVTGYGVASIVGIGREAFVSALRAPELPDSGGARKLATIDLAKYPNARAFEVPDFDASRYLGAKGLRTLDRLTKLAVVAARLALADSGLKRENEFVALSPERVGIATAPLQAAAMKAAKAELGAGGEKDKGKKKGPKAGQGEHAGASS